MTFPCLFNLMNDLRNIEGKVNLFLKDKVAGKR